MGESKGYEHTPLLPCPFCGSSGLAGTTLDDMGYVMCISNMCWGMVGYLPTDAEAVAAWNNRPGAPEMMEVLKMLRDAEDVGVAEGCSGNMGPEQRAAVDAAIAKAEGRS